MAGLASLERREKDGWTERFTKALLTVDAPVVKGLAGVELKQVVEMAVGRARPGTVRLRVRAWEAFGRWLALTRGRSWP